MDELYNNLSSLRGLEKDAYEAGYKAGLEAEIEIPVKVEKICGLCGDDTSDDPLHYQDTQYRPKCS